MEKVVLAHVSKQHSFHTAIALKRKGILYKYITTVYDKPSSFTTRFKGFLKGDVRKKADSRSCSELEDNDVLQMYELLGLVRIYINRFKFLKFLKFDLFLQRIFALKVAKYVIREKVDAIIIYDGLAKKYTDLIKRKAPGIKIIMDISISARPFMKEYFEKDMHDHNHNYFYNEEKFLWNKGYMKNVYDDFRYTDHFLVPSTIVYKSLEYCGVVKEKIIVAPYGVNINEFDFKQKEVGKGPLNILFAGHLSYRKGVHHLLDVVSKFPKGEITLSLAGGYSIDSEFYMNYKGYENIKFMGFVTRDVISRVFQESDVFILPTLGEGFGLVILESLATGTPVICTNVAGGNDAIVDYENGIVCEAGDKQALVTTLKWFIENRNKLPYMSTKARETARRYTWDAYYEKVGAEIYQVLAN